MIYPINNILQTVYNIFINNLNIFCYILLLSITIIILTMIIYQIIKATKQISLLEIAKKSFLIFVLVINIKFPFYVFINKLNLIYYYPILCGLFSILSITVLNLSKSAKLPNKLAYINTFTLAFFYSMLIQSHKDFLITSLQDWLLFPIWTIFTWSLLISIFDINNNYSIDNIFKMSINDKPGSPSNKNQPGSLSKNDKPDSPSNNDKGDSPSNMSGVSSSSYISESDSNNSILRKFTSTEENGKFDPNINPTFEAMQENLDLNIKKSIYMAILNKNNKAFNPDTLISGSNIIDIMAKIDNTGFNRFIYFTNTGKEFRHLILFNRGQYNEPLINEIVKGGHFGSVLDNSRAIPDFSKLDPKYRKLEVSTGFDKKDK